MTKILTKTKKTTKTKKVVKKAPAPKTEVLTKEKKTPRLSLYKDLMDTARLTQKTFVSICKEGNRHGWRDPGPSQFQLVECVTFRKDMSTIPDDERVINLMALAETVFSELLIIGFRKGLSYRKTNKHALEKLRAFYTEHVKVELVRYEKDEKLRLKELKKKEKE